MKKLNIVFSFVLLSFCLFVNVSSAIEINQKFYSSNVSNNNSNLAGYSQTALDTVGTYTLEDAQSILSDYLLNGNSSNFDSLINSIFSTYNEDKYVLYSYYRDSKGYYYGRLYTWNSQTTDIGKFGTTLGLVAGSDFHYIGFTYGSNNSLSFYKETYTNTSLDKVYQCVNFHTYLDSLSFFGSNSDVKKMTYKSATNSYYYWDGTSYYYQAPSTEEPETPIMPTNSEIAQAVQAFYNSDYYKNNKDFSDFMVLYNTTNGNYSFIGHTLGNMLGQVIIPPNYRYQGKLYDQQWWKFYIDENQGASSYVSTYYLYSTNNTALDVISDDGVGKISELVNLDFSSKSVIIYSTTDYPVRTYVLDETTGDYTYTDGIIEGDQYTYDENLDPTISGYNPLDNFVIVDPSQTIIGDADFGDFTNVFEENKDLFSFTENMKWLITANNKLSNYFLGFIVLCALFITLGRVLKG